MIMVRPSRLLDQAERTFRAAVEHLSQHPEDRYLLGQLAENRFTGLLGSLASATDRLDTVIRRAEIRDSGQGTRMIRVRYVRAEVPRVQHENICLVFESMKVLWLSARARRLIERAKAAPHSRGGGTQVRPSCVAGPRLRFQRR